MLTFATRIRSFLSADPYRTALILALLLYMGVFTGLAFDAHAGLRTHRSDLGQIDHSVWNSSRGRFLISIKRDFQSTRMTDHVEPIFVLISPLLWVWDDVRALLLLQVAAAGVGVLFLYDLSLRLLRNASPRGPTDEPGPRILAFALGLAYLLAPQLQSAVLTEFHAIPLAAPLILWAFWAVEARRWRQFLLAALLVAGVKEEAALLAAGLGVWGLWRGVVRGWAIRRLGAWGFGKAGDWESRRLGEREGTQEGSISHLPSPVSASRSLLPKSAIYAPLLVLLLALLWFYLATFVIVPAHAVRVYDVAESAYFQRYGALGNSPLDIAKSFVLRPGLVWQIATEPPRVQYVAGLLSVFGFLSLFGIEVLLLSLPVFLANLLSAYPAQYYGDFHYSAPLVPYTAVAAAYGLGRVWRLVHRATDRTSASFQHGAAGRAPSMALLSLWTNARTALRPLALAGLALWLLGWSVSSYAAAGRGPLGGRYDPTPVGPHERLLERFLAQIPPDAPATATAAVHPHVSHRRWVYQFPWGLDAAVPAEWALLDVTGDTDMAPGDLKAAVDEMLAGDWGVVDAADGYLLLRRGEANKVIPDAFYDFARGEPPSRAQGPPVSFGSLTLLGVDTLDWPRWRQTKITTLWRVEQTFTPGAVRPWVEVRTPAGDAIHTLDEATPPALVWLPPEGWRPGDVIRIQSLWLFLPRTWGVAAGAVHGPNPLAPGDRLPVLNREAASPPLVDPTGTLALAAAFRRGSGDVLERLPARAEEMAQLFATTGGERAAMRPAPAALLRGPGEEKVQLTGWLPSGPVPAGRPVDVWLSWRADDGDLFLRFTPFVHLRRASETVGQQDGPPRYFLAQSGPVVNIDWRQLPTSPEMEPGTYQVVVGLYSPATGERFTVLDGAGSAVGNELVLGAVTLAPPAVPDQACALIPPACESQQ